jgi:hypothetical protein
LASPKATERSSRFAANGAVRLPGGQCLQHLEGAWVAREATQGNCGMAPDINTGTVFSYVVVLVHCDDDFAFDVSFAKIAERFRNLT